MNDTLQSIPDEAWPILTIVFNVTCVVTAIWLLWTVFVWWRRSASNLTSTSTASVNRKASPDFLRVDEKARREALQRGADFEKDLDARDRAEAAQERRAFKRKETGFGRIARLIALLMSLFSLATMLAGVIFQVSFMGKLWEQYSAAERVEKLIVEHPIGVVITFGVIAYHIVIYVTHRKWEEN